MDFGCHLLLQASGLRVTSQRLYVLRILLTHRHQSLSVLTVGELLLDQGKEAHYSSLNHVLRLMSNRQLLLTSYSTSRIGSKKGRPILQYKPDISFLTSLRMVYSTELLQQLSLIKQATEQLANEDAQKTIEQFEAEVNTVIALLEEVKIPLKGSSDSAL
jgi:hypothetical protein